MEMTEAELKALETMEAYLAGKLSGDALAAFEKELDASPQLKTDLKLMETAHAAVEAYGEADLREMLGRIDAEIAPEISLDAPAAAAPQVPWFTAHRSVIGGIAAGLLLLVVVGLGLWLRPSAKTRMFRGYFAPYPDELVYRDAGDARLGAVMAPYAEGDYAEVLAAYRQGRDWPEELQLYAGIAHLGLEHGDSALAIFAPLERRIAPLWQPVLQWYTALAHLLEGEADAARAVLEALRAARGPFAKEAAEVLEEM